MFWTKPSARPSSVAGGRRRRAAGARHFRKTARTSSFPAASFGDAGEGDLGVPSGELRHPWMHLERQRSRRRTAGCLALRGEHGLAAAGRAAHRVPRVVRGAAVVLGGERLAAPGDSRRCVERVVERGLLVGEGEAGCRRCGDRRRWRSPRTRGRARRCRRSRRRKARRAPPFHALALEQEAIVPLSGKRERDVQAVFDLAGAPIDPPSTRQYAGRATRTVCGTLGLKRTVPAGAAGPCVAVTSSPGHADCASAVQRAAGSVEG